MELFTALNSFAGAVKTEKLPGVPFLFELVVVSNTPFVIVISPMQRYIYLKIHCPLD